MNICFRSFILPMIAMRPMMLMCLLYNQRWWNVRCGASGVWPFGAWCVEIYWYDLGMTGRRPFSVS